MARFLHKFHYVFYKIQRCPHKIIFVLSQYCDMKDFSIHYIIIFITLAYKQNFFVCLEPGVPHASGSTAAQRRSAHRWVSTGCPNTLVIFISLGMLFRKKKPVQMDDPGQTQANWLSDSCSETSRSRIHDGTISLRFLCIILRVFIIEDSLNHREGGYGFLSGFPLFSFTV